MQCSKPLLSCQKCVVALFGNFIALRSKFVDIQFEPKTLVTLPLTLTRSKTTLVQVGSIFHELTLLSLAAG